jgi:hypothetical protein
LCCGLRRTKGITTNYIKGAAAAGAFKVNWLAGTTFVTPPACT